MARKVKAQHSSYPNTNQAINDQFSNPFPKGTNLHDEFESDCQWMKSKYGKYATAREDEFGNKIIYKTSGYQRVVMVLLVIQTIILLAMSGNIANLVALLG